MCCRKYLSSCSNRRTGSRFKGIYFVLGGYLSPIEGRGPNEIGLSELNSKALSGEIKELILAFNFS